MTYNPVVVHENGLYDLDPSDPDYETKAPENIV